jgi:hypothetical protein
MGEAKLRRLIAQAVTPKQRADIARVVRSIELMAGGGTCLFRAVLGRRVLAWLGIPSTIAVGAMLYRAGPDKIRDVVAFCGHGNLPMVTDEGAALHYWLHCGTDLVDFSVGDWQPQAGDLVDMGPAAALGPIQWAAPPLPSFWWQSRSFFVEPWRPTGEPEIGLAWYRPVPMPDRVRAAIQGVEQDELIHCMSSILRGRCEQLADDWRAGNIPSFETTTLIVAAQPSPGEELSR